MGGGDINDNQIQENQDMDTDTNLLTLCLSSPGHFYVSSSGGSTILPTLQQFFFPPPPESAPPQNHPTPTPIQRRPRRNPTGTPPPGKPATIPPPYPWAGDRRCTVHTLDYLYSHNIFFIGGEVQCKKCESRYNIRFNLEEKFREIADFIAGNVGSMHDRAPKIWTSPALPDCRRCEERNSVRPVMAEKKKSINWLFLFLGQMLGCCNLNQLKYFCKHTMIHRTGAKDRLVFSTYMGLCNQLQPNGPSRI